jgi:WD40 repeat protein
MFLEWFPLRGGLMDDSRTCPDPQELRHLLESPLPEAEVDRLGRHVLACAACAQLLETILANDPLLPVLDELLPGQPGDSPFVEGMVERLVQEPPASDRFIASPFSRSTVSASPLQGTPLPDSVPGFEILGELGRGGMGHVFKARHLGLNRLVALKMIRTGVDASAEQLVRFRSEAEAAAQLVHPHIVQIYETGEHLGCPWFAMEYLDGGSLDRLLCGAPLSPHSAAELLKRLARAVHFAHRNGVIHRDLKPANVLLARSDTPDALRLETATGAKVGGLEPRIADFGIAKRLESDSALTQTGHLLGTPSYAAPEQALGKSRLVGPAADIYGLGAILYEVLTGRPPFKAETAYDTVLQVINEEPVPPRRSQENLPRDLETICLKCLHKDPLKRYASAQDLADDLDCFLTSRPIRARRTGTLGRLALWCRRRPALAATIGVALVAVALVAGASGYQVLQERKKFRQQRDAARANLYRALVGEARATLRARDTGWWWKVMENLRQAGALAVADRNVAELRDQAIECIGLDYTSLRVHATCAAHAGPVTRVAISPDGRFVASGARDGTVRISSMPDGKLLAELTGQGGPVSGVAFCRGGAWVASGSTDGRVRVWKLSELARPATKVPTATRAADRVLDLKAGAVNAMEISSDGLWLVAGCEDGAIRLLKVDSLLGTATNQRVLSGHSAAVTCLAVSADGLLVSGGKDRTLRWWDLTTLQEIYSLSGHDSSTLAFDSTTSDITLVGGPNALGLSRVLWRDPTVPNFGTEQMFSKPPSQIGFDRRGRLLTASVDGTVRIWNIYDRARLKDLAVAEGTWGAATSLVESDGSEWLVVGYADGHVRIWAMTRPADCRILHDRFMYQRAAFVGSQPRLATYPWVYDLSGGQDFRRKSFLPPAIRALAVDPAGARLASGEQDGGLTIGMVQDLEERVRTAGHSLAVTSMKSAPDGHCLASASADGTVKLWNWQTGACVRTLAAGLGPLHGLDWSDDSRLLAVTGEEGVVVYNLQDEPRRRLVKRHSLRSSSVAVRGGVLACTGAERGIEVRSLDTGNVVRRLYGHEGAVVGLAFSQDGDVLADFGEETICLWDCRRDYTLRRGPVNSLRTSAVLGLPLWLRLDPKGHYLAAGFLHRTVFWDLRVESLLPVAVTSAGPCAEFLPDGSAVLYGTRDGTLARWTLAELDKLRAGAQSLPEAAGSKPLELAPQMLVPGGHDPPHAVWGLATSPDGHWIATCGTDGTVKLWDAQGCKLVRTLRGHNDLIWCVAFSPDSKYLASGSGDARIWEVSTGREVQRLPGHEKLVTGLAFHPNRPWLVSCSYDGQVILWHFREGKKLAVLHRLGSRVYDVAFAPDGRRLAAACADRRVALWSLADAPGAPTPPTRLLEGHPSEVWAVAFSADGRYLATGSNPGVIILWNAWTFQRIATLRATTTEVRGLSFSHDSRLLAGAAYLGPTVVWDLQLLRKTLAGMNLDW